MPSPTEAHVRDERIPWRRLCIAGAIGAVAFLPLARVERRIYPYAFPLFSVGSVYVLQFRDEFPRRWKVALVGAGALGAAGAQTVMSGHVLWNTLFLGHAGRRLPGRRSWLLVLVGSMLHLFGMKLLFWRPVDVLGSVASAGIGVAALTLLDRHSARADVG